MLNKCCQRGGVLGVGDVPTWHADTPTGVMAQRQQHTHSGSFHVMERKYVHQHLVKTIPEKTVVTFILKMSTTNPHAYAKRIILQSLQMSVVITKTHHPKLTHCHQILKCQLLFL